MEAQASGEAWAVLGWLFLESGALARRDSNTLAASPGAPFRASFRAVLVLGR